MPASAGPPQTALRRATDAAARSLLRLGFPLLKLWWRVRHPTLEGVYVAVWHGDRVLLIRNSYHTACSFPSGRRGRREPPVEAALRELREEVGIRAGPAALRHVGDWTVETRLVSDHVHVFELHVAAEPAVEIDRREVVWAAFEPFERARERALLPVVARYLGGLTGPPRP